MFGFLRKKQPPVEDHTKALTEADSKFLEGMIRALQYKYPDLLHQLQPGFMVLKGPTIGGRNGAYTIGTDEDLYTRYSNKEKGYFTIKNIWAINRN